MGRAPGSVEDAGKNLRSPWEAVATSVRWQNWPPGILTGFCFPCVYARSVANQSMTLVGLPPRPFGLYTFFFLQLTVGHDLGLASGPITSPFWGHTWVMMGRPSVVPCPPCRTPNSSACSVASQVPGTATLCLLLPPSAAPLIQLSPAWEEAGAGPGMEVPGDEAQRKQVE